MVTKLAPERTRPCRTRERRTVELPGRADHAAIRHLGPTAQDFRAAFGLGENDTAIHTVHADGAPATSEGGGGIQTSVRRTSTVLRVTRE